MRNWSDATGLRRARGTGMGRAATPGAQPAHHLTPSQRATRAQADNRHYGKPGTELSQAHSRQSVRFATTMTQTDQPRHRHGTPAAPATLPGTSHRAHRAQLQAPGRSGRQPDALPTRAAGPTGGRSAHGTERRARVVPDVFGRRVVRSLGSMWWSELGDGAGKGGGFLDGRYQGRKGGRRGLDLCSFSLPRARRAGRHLCAGSVGRLWVPDA